MAEVPRVRVEVLWLSVSDQRIAYRVVDADLDGAEAPDDVAYRLRAGAEPAQLLHSTSWRYDGATVILTYVALPDSHPVRARRLPRAVSLACSEDPTEPDPQARINEVVAHACRHLCFLDCTDPVVNRVLCAHPALREVIVRWPADVAGERETASEAV